MVFHDISFCIAEAITLVIGYISIFWLSITAFIFITLHIYAGSRDILDLNEIAWRQHMVASN